VMRYLKRFWKRLKYRLGWRLCEKCRGFHKIKWVKDVIYHPEEPPMFYHWECTNCGNATPVRPSGLTEEVVRKLGYKNFIDYAKRNGLVNPTSRDRRNHGNDSHTDAR
jgi:hypothetical protein